MRALKAIAVVSTVIAATVGLAGVLTPPPASAGTTTTFSGLISYGGTHTGDSLYVAVLDTAGVEDVTILDLQVYAVGPPPFSQGYGLEFDNTGVSPLVLIAAFLDTDGGGIDDVGGADVFGWYAGSMEPTAISSTSSALGLDFELPRAEIHGTVTFAPDQVEARVDVSGDADCLEEGFRPGHYVFSEGAYAILGVYAGTYCVSATGSVSPGRGAFRVCHGPGGCETPTLITVTATEVRTGVDLDFNTVVPVEESTWGRVKNQYR